MKLIKPFSVKPVLRLLIIACGILLPATWPAQTTQPATAVDTADSGSGASVHSPTLPAQYQAMEGESRFNSNEPRVIPDGEELSRLRYTAPQWLQQSLAFPPPNELLRYLGKEPAATRGRAASSIKEVVNPAMLPKEFPDRLIPMARWAIFYEDWRKHGGTDVFITKFQNAGFTVMLVESHNHVVIVARELEGSRSREFQGMIELGRKYAEAILTEPLKPASKDAFKIFRTSLAPPYVYGYYTPRIEALTNQGSASDLLTTSGGQPNEHSTSARASAVRFFCNGEFCAFMVLKPIKSGELKNPFEPRFEPLNLAQPEKVPFWEDQSMAARRDLPDAEVLRRRQVREYLGNFFFDQQGNALTDKIPVKDLEREFSELSAEQKVDIARRKIVDEKYALGMTAFAAGDTTPSLEAWTSILQYEPENARAAILLQLVIKQRAKVAYNGNIESAKSVEPAIAKAIEAMNRQQTLLSLRQQQEGLEVARERSVQDFRVRAIDYFSEGSWQESLREWEKLLDIDPGNATALLFKDICETKIKELERRRRQ